MFKRKKTQKKEKNSFSGDTFWSKPDGLSIVDVLALGFSALYFVVVVTGVFGGNLGLSTFQENMNLLMSTILAGYFSDQVVKNWHREKGRPKEPTPSAPHPEKGETYEEIQKDERPTI